MRARSHAFPMMVVVAALLTGTVVSGCYHHGYVVAEWNVGERPYYERWERETQREHREYEQRKADEQKEYWEWRRHHQDSESR